MKRGILLIFLLVLFMPVFVSAIEPMKLRTIKEIKSVNPSDVANLGFGTYQVSGQYNLGAYHQGKWMGFENKKCEDLKYGAVWIEFSWERPATDVVLVDGAGNEREIYLPASTPAENSTYGEYYWIAEDGSSYYALSNHRHGWPDLTYEQAFKPEHLARASMTPNQKNPAPESEECKSIQGNVIKIKGQLLDQMTNEPISGAKLSSAYEFSPKEVETDSNGNFEFSISADYKGGWNFYVNCYGWAGTMGLQKNYQGYGTAITKDKFDSNPEIVDASGKTEMDIGKLYAWPGADISTQSDVTASFNIQYKYKNSEGYNGPGNGNFVKEHYLTASLPLDYDVFIQFTDESGKNYKSETYHVPANAKCAIINLKYFNGQSEWSILSKVEPTEKTGPIKINVPESIKEERPETFSNLCYGCLKETTCYPLGYRKSGEYCSESKSFILQSSSDLNCDNNFECSSNICVSGKCISEGFIQKILNWFKNLFG